MDRFPVTLAILWKEDSFRYQKIMRRLLKSRILFFRFYSVEQLLDYENYFEGSCIFEYLPLIDCPKTVGVCSIEDRIEYDYRCALYFVALMLFQVKSFPLKACRVTRQMRMISIAGDVDSTDPNTLVNDNVDDKHIMKCMLNNWDFLQIFRARRSRHCYVDLFDDITQHFSDFKFIITDKRTLHIYKRIQTPLPIVAATCIEQLDYEYVANTWSITSVVHLSIPPCVLLDFYNLLHIGRNYREQIFFVYKLKNESPLYAQGSPCEKCGSTGTMSTAIGHWYNSLGPLLEWAF